MMHQYIEDDNSVDIEDIYYMMLSNIAEAIECVDPIIVAAILVAQGLAIYRTSLSDEDFEVIIDSIYKNKDMVQRFEQGTLH